MGEDKGTDSRADQTTDDSYWAALFATEQSFGNGTEPDSVEVPVQAEPDSVVDVLPLEAPGNTSLPLDPLPDSADPWAMARGYMEEDRVLQLRVIGHNKGGLLVNWNGLPGFVPASQLVDFPQFHLPRERMVSLAEWHDRNLQLKIIEVDKPQNRLILSERATLVAAEHKESLLGSMRPGERRRGLVTNLTDFGAFIDLGGAEGLVHKSEISWSRVQHPGDVLQPGQSIEVLILGVDPTVARIALSIKQLHADPWLTAEERYKPGQQVRGIVGNITHFGAFVVLEPELEGLVHYSELAEGTFMHPRDVVRTGEEVVARVLSVEAPRKRIALSLRGLNTGP